MTGQSILFWSRPAVSGIFMGAIDGMLLYAHASGMGLIALLVLFCFITYLVTLVFRHFGGTIGPIVPDQSLWSFEDICRLLASKKTNAKVLLDYCLGNQFGNGIMKIICVFLIWGTLAIVSNIVGRFWYLFLALNVILIAPGVWNYSHLVLPGRRPHKD
jgi:hypothetical protein